MRFCLLLTVLLWSFCLSAKAQVETVELKFETEKEKVLWEAGIELKDPYHLFMAVHADENTSTDSWEKVLNATNKKFEKSGASLKLLRAIFEKSHKYLFKTYEQHSSFNQMLQDGYFDCVSGSATLAMLLDQYGFDFEVIETDYHVFIIAELGGSKVILESTLPIGGLITSPTEVKKYLANYQGDSGDQILSLNQRLGAPAINYSDNTIFRKVDLQQLAGLQYYNDAIAHFNEQSYDMAIDQLAKAYKLYPADRIAGLKDLAIAQKK
ncbi:hypothetical protein [Algoriphagus hitonicola]|uniref:Transglutaminase-like superfamily protein n=1 Tax=Algoriphagus hitonicola TaxID=435880 RepID=A0A1I2S2L6_9BACT|nr:hypothetical protein [Algoriphagus hitonicola]SFG46583.1 hypothetical protein SAMN04487988_10479 [Algoriphagus hitonicola]